MEGKEMQERSREVRDGENRDFTDGLNRRLKKQAPGPPSPRVKDMTLEPIPDDNKAQQAPVKTKEPSELSSTGARVTEGRNRPVPPPRRGLSSSIPVLALRTKTSQSMDRSPAAGSSSANQRLPSSAHVTSPASRWPKVNINHPWLTIIHPGPWTQLPPAPVLRSKSALRRSWYRPKVPPPNPFGEDVDEVTPNEPAEQTNSLATPVHSGNDDSMNGVTNTARGSSQSVRDRSQTDISDLEETGNTGDTPADVTEAAAAGPQAPSPEAESHILPRSLAVPGITSGQWPSPLLPADVTEANEGDGIVKCQSQTVCREKPFDEKPAMPDSNTFQTLPSGWACAPDHGFPLIKRKVQTDHDIPREGLQVEMKELDKRLEAMELRGVELERTLRECTNDKKEEQMLKEWFSVIIERHILVRRDTELVHLTTQQKLEEKQADVEYKLRCLLNKSESDWSQEDRSQERQLMDELVAIIEQRNQIVCNLDQDKQRERGEDMLLEAVMKNKEWQKEGLKELKRSKGKFKLTKVFKMLCHKAESATESTERDEAQSLLQTTNL